MKLSITSRLFALSLIIVLGVFAYYQFDSLIENVDLKELMEDEEYDQPGEARMFEFERTKDPALGYPPIERLYQAHADLQSSFSSKRAIQNVNWTERGPNNVGGRTRALMFDPNDPTSKKVWSGGVTGGLWVTDDITQKDLGWTNVGDILSTLNITSLAYDPNNTKTFYFGSGEGWYGGGMVRGNGIYKSEDAGATWTPLTSTQVGDFDFVQKVVVTNNSTLLAATRSAPGGGGIFRSDDGGATWTKVINENRGADIEILGNVIYASTGIFTEGKMWKSTDDGLSWTNITPSGGGERIEIGVHPNHTNTVYAVASNRNDVKWFRRSDDGGATWTSLTIPKYLDQSTCKGGSSDFTRGQAWYDLILAVHPDDEKTVVVGGIDLHRSFDAGKTWEPISYWTSACEIYVHADQHSFQYRPNYPNQAISGNDGGVFYVSDITVAKSEGGPVFEQRNVNYNVTQFYACATLNEVGGNYFLAGAQDNGSHQFKKEGVNSTFEITGGDGAFCFIDQNDGDIQITSYVNNSYYVTKDFWDNVISLGDGSKGLFINPADYNSNTKTLFAAGGSDELLIYKLSVDKPSEDTLNFNFDGGYVTAVTASTYDDNVVFVGVAYDSSSPKVFMLSGVNDDTHTAVDITGANFPEAGNINNIALGESNDHLMVIYSNYGVVSVWETIDGGATWNNKEGNLPDIPIRWALYNPANYDEVLLATDLGVWSTDKVSDAVPAWEPTNEGLSNVRCDMLKYRSSDGLVVLATHGRGLYTTDIFANTSVADFYSDEMVAYQGLDINFKNASIKATSYSWDFGDGSSSADMDPTHKYSTVGDFTVTLTINGDNSLTKSRKITVLPNKKLNYLLADGGDFESNTNDFAAVTVSGTGFELGKSDITGKDGTVSGNNAWVLGIDSTTYEPYSEAYLYTPMYDFSLSGAYSLEFYTKYAIEDNWDGFILEYSTDLGKTWYKVGDYLDPANWYNQIAIDQAIVFDPGKPFFSGDTGDQFVKKSIDLSSMSNNKNVAFRFTFKSDPGSEEAGLALDDFQVFGPSSTAVSLDFGSDVSSSCPGEVVTFTNKSTGSIDSYTWDFGDGAEPPTAEGYGPFEVKYSSEGDKSVILSAKFSTGSDQVNKTFSVGKKPMDIILSTPKDSICSGDMAQVDIPGSEVGVNYQLINVADNSNVGSSVEGTGSTLSLMTDALDFGTFTYKVFAFVDGGCTTNLGPSLVFRVANRPEVSISANDQYLTTSYKGADYYQWYKDGELIDGATSETYTANNPGSYTLEIARNGCSAVSNAVEVLPLEVPSAMSKLALYPNPVVDELQVSMNYPVDYTIIIYDNSGKRYHKSIMQNGAKFKLDMSHYESGIYFAEISTVSGSVVRKIIKQ